MLNAFRNKLFNAKKVEGESESDVEKAKTSKESNVEESTATAAAAAAKTDSSNSDVIVMSSGSLTSLLTHKLDIDDEVRTKVIDANVADHERYDIFDPRNPMNKRKREESRELTRDKKSRPIGGASRDLL